MFNRAGVRALNPGQWGCYGLCKYDAHQHAIWIYIGEGDIRDRLLAHLNNDDPLYRGQRADPFLHSGYAKCGQFNATAYRRPETCLQSAGWLSTTAAINLSWRYVKPCRFSKLDPLRMFGKFGRNWVVGVL